MEKIKANRFETESKELITKKTRITAMIGQLNFWGPNTPIRISALQ